MNSRIYSLIAALTLLPTAVQARDVLRVVGSSTVFPFVAAAAEQFGREGTFRTPIVEATGTGGGIKIFCSGVGEDYPDMANASRRIKPSEIAHCAEHGIHEITELAIGYDGIVLANARPSPAFALSRRAIYLALARDIPQNGKRIANPYQRWSEIDASLPNLPIMVYGPPPSSGTRDAFVELVMEAGCKEVPEVKLLSHSDAEYKTACSAVREDGAFIEAGEDDNLIVQKLINNPDALGVFGYSFLESNAARVKANAIDGIAPTEESIETGRYKVARSLYVYVKNAHLSRMRGLREFAVELVSDAASGPDGYLMVKGLLPLADDEHERMKKVAQTLEPNISQNSHTGE